MSLRNNLYQAAKLLGDTNAIKNGTVIQRIYRRYTGRLASRVLNKLPLAKEIKKLMK